MRSFIFGEGQQYRTPEELAKARSVANALLANQRAPRDVGEGLSAIGQAILYRSLLGRADASAEAGQDSRAAVMNPIIAALGGQSFPAAPGSSKVADALAGKKDDPNVGSTIDFARADSGDDDTSPLAFTGVSQAGKGWTTVQTADGQTIRRTGSRNWRNNNPGNIEYGPFAKSAGAVGTDGRFAVFPTLEAGRAAKEKLLFDSPNYRDKTLAQAINRWAPPSENNTASYYGQLARAAGVDPNVRMADLTPQQRQAVLSQMEVVEGFRPGREQVMGGPAATAVTAFAGGQPVPPAPTQVASLDPSIGIANAAPKPMQPGPMASDPAHAAFVDRMTSPRSMTGGAPMPMQGMPSAQPTPQPQQPSLPAPQQIAQAQPQGGPDLSRIPVAAGGTSGAYQPGQGPSLQQLYTALQNPWLSDGDRSILGAEIERQQQANDPYRQLQLEKLRRDIATPQKNWQKLDDNTLFDPSSGEIKQVEGGHSKLFEGTGLDAQAWNILQTADPSSREYATAYSIVSQPKQQLVQTADGMVPVLVPPQLPSWLRVPGDPSAASPGAAPATPGPIAPPEQQGNAAPVQPGGVPGAPIPGTAKPMTKEQSDAATFADRMRDASAVLEGVKDAGSSMWGQSVTDNAYIPDAVEGWLTSGDFQKFAQARRNFINAVLRRESGAVISPSEFSDANKQYFPMPGDTAQTLEQKKRNRETAMQGMVRAAGPRYAAPSPADGGAVDYRTYFGGR